VTSETNIALRHALVVVTGASTGIGAATARELAQRGFHILAGIRSDADADAIRSANVEPSRLDVTNEAEIAMLVKRIADDPDRRPLRALVNNAGIQINAPVEALPLSEWRRLFDVNLFGHVAMTQALLPALIASRGTVVNVTSVGGKLAMAGYGPYAGTKFALEAVSDSLRREVAAFGVKVVVIEPGAVTTEMTGRLVVASERVASGMTAEQHGRYDALMQAVIAQAQTLTREGAGRPAEEVGRVIADAIISERPRTRYTVGRDAAIGVRLARFVSDRMLDSMLARALKPYLPKARQTP
jgi:NAD(P)-dependent dehydrogenase (short-subunit alcohol dehydrogenase family)